MKRSPAGLALALMSFVAAASTAAAAERVRVPYPTEYPTADEFPARNIVRVSKLDVDVWINKDEGGIYRPGESMRVYFRSNGDGYVLVFNVDTEGYIHLVYPYGAEDPPYVEGGRAYRIPSRSDPYDLVADGPPGIEYVVAVASPYPFQNLPWYLSVERADGNRSDLDDEDVDDTESGRIVGDPYVGIDRIIRRIAPPGREDRIATNETYFYIGQRVEYPRYVCADCHYHPFYFDPYLNACSAFEIRIDATWAHYAPIRFGNVRPRYIYRVRPSAPTRYRQWKSQWSSLDGRTALRTRFLPDRDIRYRREHAPRTKPQPQQRPEIRDLRRYREGRIWRGRDEILRLRERRDRVNPPVDGNRDRAKAERPSNRGGWRDRGDRQTPPTERGYRQRGERRAPEDQGDRPSERQRQQRERAQPPENRGNRERERPQPPREERERPQPPRENRDQRDRTERNRGDSSDRGGRDNQRVREDRGNQDNGRQARGRPEGR